MPTASFAKPAMAGCAGGSFIGLLSRIPAIEVLKINATAGSLLRFNFLQS
jgi:hypothetical protein